ncbi:MAG TPA: hypothetical protein VFN65_03950 [Solirubrobacteraceae bacterium]|nr:hypothetical protein [Solirubrobacteraceae bacterium]
MGLLLYILVLGLLVGALARLLLPGPDPMSIPATIGLGLAGNFLAGLIYLALRGHGAPGLIVSVFVSMLILWVIRRSRGGGVFRPRA